MPDIKYTPNIEMPNPGQHSRDTPLDQFYRQEYTTDIHTSLVHGPDNNSSERLDPVKPSFSTGKSDFHGSYFDMLHPNDQSLGRSDMFNMLPSPLPESPTGHAETNDRFPGTSPVELMPFEQRLYSSIPSLSRSNRNDISTTTDHGEAARVEGPTLDQQAKDLFSRIKGKDIEPKSKDGKETRNRMTQDGYNAARMEDLLDRKPHLLREHNVSKDLKDYIADKFSQYNQILRDLKPKQ